MRFNTLLANSIAAAIMFSSMSHAEQWEVLGDFEKVSLAVETDDISPAVPPNWTPSGIRSAWVAFIFHENQRADNGALYRISKNRVNANCGKQTTSSSATLLYAGQFEKLIARMEGETPFEKVVPGSVGDAVYRFLCAPVQCVQVSFGTQCNNTWKTFRD